MNKIFFLSLFILPFQILYVDSTSSKETVPIKKILTLVQAEQIAKDYLNLDGNKYQMTIIQKETQIHDFGFVFFYAPLKFLETKDIKYIVPGNGPLVVDNHDQKVHSLPTSVESKKAIQMYREQRKKN